MPSREQNTPFKIGGGENYKVTNPVQSGTGNDKPTLVSSLPPFQAVNQTDLERRYDRTDYDADYLYFGKELNVGGYRIRRVDRQQEQTYATGDWEDRETLTYS